MLNTATLKAQQFSDVHRNPQRGPGKTSYVPSPRRLPAFWNAFEQADAQVTSLCTLCCLISRQNKQSMCSMCPNQSNISDFSRTWKYLTETFLNIPMLKDSCHLCTGVSASMNPLFPAAGAAGRSASSSDASGSASQASQPGSPKRYAQAWCLAGGGGGGGGSSEGGRTGERGSEACSECGILPHSSSPGVDPHNPTSF